MFVKQSESVEKLVERDGLILCVSDGKLRAGDEAGAKSEKKQYARKVQRFYRGARRIRRIGVRAVGNGAPIKIGWDGWRGVFWRCGAHEVLGAASRIGKEQYNISSRVRARAKGEKLGTKEGSLRQNYSAFFS